MKAESIPPSIWIMFIRLLTPIEPDPETLWTEALNLVAINAGALGIDDSTLDKPYAKDIALVTRNWSGKHHDVVQGINLILDRWRPQDPLRLSDI